MAKESKTYHQIANHGKEWEAYEKAKRAFETHERGIKDVIRERTEAFERRIRARLKKGNEKTTNRLRLERDALYGKYMTYLGEELGKLIERQRAALKKEGFDETTVRHGYARPRYGMHYGTGTYTMHCTGKRGRFEVWTPASESPASMSDYSLPKPGDIVIRHVKKNGEDALTFDAETFTVRGLGRNKEIARKWRLDGSKMQIRLREDNDEEVPYDQVYWPPKEEKKK